MVPSSYGAVEERSSDIRWYVQDTCAIMLSLTQNPVPIETEITVQPHYLCNATCACDNQCYMNAFAVHQDRLIYLLSSLGFVLAPTQLLYTVGIVVIAPRTPES